MNNCSIALLRVTFSVTLFTSIYETSIYEIDNEYDINI